MLNLNVLSRPSKYGYKECECCDGLGSINIKDKFWFCKACDGIGILKASSDIKLNKISNLDKKIRIQFN